jgi:hypothetical protein
MLAALDDDAGFDGDKCRRDRTKRMSAHEQHIIRVKQTKNARRTLRTITTAAMLKCIYVSGEELHIYRVV